MNMKHLGFTGAGIVAVLITSSLAMHYRSQAIRFQRELSAASEKLDDLAAEPVVRTPGQMPGVRRDAATVPAPLPEPVANNRQAPPPGAAASQGSPAPERPWRPGTNWMETIRISDPKRYEEMQQRRLELLQNIQDAWAQRTNYFMNRDTSKMSESEASEYGMMVALLDQTKTLSEQLQIGVPPAERRQVISNLRSNLVVLTPMLDNERNHEYFDLAVGMGHSDEEAAAFVSYVNQITSNTSIRAIFPPGIMRGNMRGGFPPGAGTAPESTPPAL